MLCGDMSLNRTISGDKVVFWYGCDLCGKEYQYGGGIYNGRNLSHYKLDVCNSCLRNNNDGLAPFYEAKFLAHLEKHNIPVPARNEKNWFPL